MSTIHTGLDFRILGPMEVSGAEGLLEITSRKQRALLVALLLEVGHAISTDRLIDRLWGGEPPPQARVTLRSYVSHLRRELDAAAAGAPVLTTRGNGYALDVDPGSVDVVRFDRHVRDARQALASGSPVEALRHGDAALALWRGEPLADAAYDEFAQSAIARLRELHLAVQEHRFEALLRLGRHEEAVAALEEFVAEHPLREQPHAQLMLALYRSARAPDAVNVYRRFRERLADEVGLDPSIELEKLATDILNRAEHLAPPVIHLRTEHAAGTAPGSDAAFVGRSAELRRLATSLEGLPVGRGGMVLVAGEPGVGKTTLLERLGGVAAREGVSVHWGRCPSAEGMPAFWPWVQILRSVAVTLDDEQLRSAASDVAAPVGHLVPEVKDRLGEGAEVSGGDPSHLRFLLYEAVTTFLRRAAVHVPRVLFVDDIHWADVASLELLTFLAPQLATAPLLAVAAYRDLPAERSDSLDAALATVAREETVDELELKGFERSDVARLAEAVSGVEVTDELTDRLLDRTGGNPFFVRHVAGVLRDGSGTGDALVIPTSVRHVLGRRLQTLPAHVQDLLEVAAVVGREFDLKTVAAASSTSLEDALDVADVAAAHGLLESANRPLTGFQFPHALVREAVIERMSAGKAVRIHAAVALALESAGAPVDTVAEHMWRGADLLGDTKPLRWTMAAAESAVAMFAFEQAETYLRRALDLVERAQSYDPQAELTVRLKLFELVARTKGWGAREAEQIVMRVRELADTVGLQREHVPLWWGLWAYLRNRNDLATSDEMAEQLRGHAEASQDPSTLAAALLLCAFPDFYVDGGPARALEDLRKAQELAAQADAEALARFPIHLGLIIDVMTCHAAALARDPAAGQLGDDAIRLAHELGDPFGQAIALSYTAHSSVLSFDPAAALRRSEASIALCDRHGFWVTTLSAVPHAWASAHLGVDPQQQIRRLEAAIDPMRESGQLGSVWLALVCLAEVRLLVDDVDGARDALRAAQQAGGAYPVILQRVANALQRRSQGVSPDPASSALS